jgi:K+/H+ antiporter YhaU regulatory subunit KhtT
MTTKTKAVKAIKEKKLTVSAANIAKAASRLLTQRLVSTEIDYIQRTLGNSSSQQQIDATVLAVRKLPWSSIVAPE